jgi:DNA-binding LacI/PurR family transcriptional regulator
VTTAGDQGGPGRGRRRPGPSIADVAALAGVSPQTVSRVSTGADKVRPQTKTKVLAAMSELGYSPNRAARALRNGSFGAIGLIAHRLGRTGEAKTVEAVVEAAQQAGYTVTLVDLETPSADDVSDAVVRLNNQALDGLIIIRAETYPAAAVTFPARLPVVVADSRFTGHHPGVGSDQTAGSRRAVRHLLDLGHRTVHHLAGPGGSRPAEMRSESWRRTLRKAGVEPPPVFEGDWTARSGYEQGLLIAADETVTAVFCANDEMAAGLIRALGEHGRAVPGQVSVVGFDDIPIAGYLSPPLTTVAQDFPAIGRELVAMVVHHIDTGVAGREHRLIPTRLVVRDSTGPAPR